MDEEARRFIKLRFTQMDEEGGAGNQIPVNYQVGRNIHLKASTYK